MRKCDEFSILANSVTSWPKLCRSLAKRWMWQMLTNICQIFDENIFNCCKRILDFGAVQKSANLVDLRKFCKRSVALWKSTSIQPRARQSHVRTCSQSPRFWRTKSYSRILMDPYWTVCMMLCNLWCSHEGRSVGWLAPPRPRSPGQQDAHPGLNIRNPGAVRLWSITKV